MDNKIDNLQITTLTADNIKSYNLIGKIEMPCLKADIVWGLPTFIPNECRKEDEQ